jgi:hypothetical protein
MCRIKLYNKLICNLKINNFSHDFEQYKIVAICLHCFSPLKSQSCELTELSQEGLSNFTHAIPSPPRASTCRHDKVHRMGKFLWWQIQRNYV